MRRTAILIWCASLVAVGCQRSTDGESAFAGGLQSLPLTVQDVRQVSGFGEFTRTADDDRTVADTATPEGPCRALFDQGVAFGEDWVDSRTVVDEADVDIGEPASVFASIIQTVVAYPDDDSARAAFDRRLVEMDNCAALRLEFMGGTVLRPVPATVAYVHDQWTVASAVKSSVVVDVSVTVLPDSETIASEILQRIVDRID